MALKRLQNTVENSKELQRLMKEKQEMKQNYFDKKLKIMEQDVLIKQNIASILRRISKNMEK